MLTQLAVWYRLFAYGPANATAIPKPRYLLRHLNLVSAYRGCSGKEAVVVVVVSARSEN